MLRWDQLKGGAAWRVRHLKRKKDGRMRGRKGAGSLQEIK